MSQFQLFDVVQLIEEIPLSGDFTNAAVQPDFAPVGTRGAIVEMFNDGEAYLVELFGGWTKAGIEADELISAEPDDPQAFRETIGVETVYPHQLRLVKPAKETMGARGHLVSILEDLPEELIAEVRDFAEFLQQKQRQKQA
ncbi:DUF2281 domain-containing protein [Egbenema bharatensis]|uniref:DUF2281 domain-containing protein n=1 Tax=Egbenema bharatensis TaxID=3463334 RepID=UPI003A85C573